MQGADDLPFYGCGLTGVTTIEEDGTYKWEGYKQVVEGFKKGNPLGKVSCSYPFSGDVLELESCPRAESNNYRTRFGRKIHAMANRGFRVSGDGLGNGYS